MNTMQLVRFYLLGLWAVVADAWRKLGDHQGLIRSGSQLALRHDIKDGYALWREETGDPIEGAAQALRAYHKQVSDQYFRERDRIEREKGYTPPAHRPQSDPLADYEWTPHA